MAESPRNIWSAFEQLESTLGTAAAVLASHRPAEVRVRAELQMGGEDPAATAAWLEQSSPRSSGAGANVGADAGAATHRDDDFQVLEVIGRGGMGVVHKAVQRSFGREVALKRAAGSEPALIEQFLSEARITGLLEHANIVPVHQLRVPREGSPELVMKLLKGRSWRDLLHTEAGANLDLEDHLRILLSVCNAVAYAHEHQVIHRDLKPENVMTDDFGQVFVVDWGLAASLDVERCARLGTFFAGDARQPAGTPGYMAPELASGDGAQQGVRTDVYLLGACLHEVITRQRRHEGPSVREVLERATVSAPFAYDDAVPRELAAICARATSAAPADRYPEVISFRRAIEDFLAHRQAYAIAEKGLAQVARLREAIARYNAAPSRRAERAGLAAEGPESADARTTRTLEERDREVHVHHAEAQFALKHALEIWPGVPEAEEGLAEARRLMLEHAFVTEDLTLAARLAADEASKARVAALRARLDARTHELLALRSAARRLDWANARGALGTAYIFGGIIGASMVLSTRYVLHAHLAHSLLINAGVWLLSAVLIGLVAFVTLRRVQVPDSLVSPRLLGTWGAVSLSSLTIGAMNELRPVPLAHDMPYCALVIALGFTAMAFQTRRWLLAPALAFYLGALLIAVVPDRGFEVIGLLWLLVMSGVGVALKRGARLDAPEDEAREASRGAGG